MPDDKRPVIYDEKLSFFRNLILQARLVWLLFTDPRVPVWLKGMPMASLAYLLWPVDLLPDLTIPILAQLDDVAILLLGFRLFIDMCPGDIVAEHMRTLTGQEGDWKVEAKQKSNPDSETVETTVIEAKYDEPPAEDSQA